MTRTHPSPARIQKWVPARARFAGLAGMTAVVYARRDDSYTLPSSARMKIVRAARRSSFTGFPPAVGSSGAILTI
jgi:hypothetical protein